MVNQNQRSPCAQSRVSGTIIINKQLVLKGNLASRVTWDQEGTYVIQVRNPGVFRSPSLGGMSL